MCWANALDDWPSITIKTVVTPDRKLQMLQGKLLDFQVLIPMAL